MPADIVYAVSTTVTADPVTGLGIRVGFGDPWDADDPFVKSHPDLFSTECPPAAVRRTVAPSGVEMATRAPGERRGTRRGN